METATYLDNGFYIITNSAAGSLVRVLGQNLPKWGYEKFVMLELAASDGLKYRVNAWLIRTDLRHSCRADIKHARGWRWALHGIRRDSGEYLPAIGKAFQFLPVASTQAIAA